MSSARAGRWRLRPYDPKCKTFIDPDPVVEDQIRCKVPLWSGDFDELKPELTAQGIRLDDLPKLTVYDVGQYVIRAAQGGALQCGPVGTVAGTIVGTPPPGRAATIRAPHERDVKPKLIAALTQHHRYSDGSCLNSDPIASNDLARKAEVSKSTASLFFKREFRSHQDYRMLCRKGNLVAALKMLNGEFSPRLLVTGPVAANHDE
jgi:hypothetical protein